MRLGDLLQRVAPINDGFDLPGLNQLFDGDQICQASRGNRTTEELPAGRILSKQWLS